MKSYKAFAHENELNQATVYNQNPTCQRNQLCEEYLDEPETQTAELRTDVARYSAFQNEASAYAAVADEPEINFINREAHAAFVAGCASYSKTFLPYKIHVKVQLCL
jgi:hypothetical protein